MRQRLAILVCPRGQAFTTDPEEREVASIGEETVVAQYALMHWLKRDIVDLEHGVAVLADEMMVGSIAHKLEEAHTAPKVRLRHHTNRDEQIERAINRREVDRRVARRRPLQNLIRGDMPAMGSQRIEHNQPLWRHPQALMAQALYIRWLGLGARLPGIHVLLSCSTYKERDASQLS